MSILINDLELLKYCYQRVTGKELNIDGDEFPKDKYACFGEYREDGEPLWVVTAHSFCEGHECYLDFTVNHPGLFSRHLFCKMAYVVFDYIFKQAKLIRCSINVRASNKKSLKLVKAWGFKEEGYRRLSFCPPNIEDAYLLGMIKDECKWI